LEDLAKSGYKPDMKYKSLTILYFWLLTENQIQKSGDFLFFYFFQSHFWQLKTSKINSF